MRSAPFQIKICGITSVEDANAAVNAGADAIGLNFFRGSSRYIAPDQAAAIAVSIGKAITRVGVFVNASIDELQGVLDRVPLDVVQLHGDETPQFIQQAMARLNLPIVRAVRSAPPFEMIDEYLQECVLSGCLPDAVLIDSSAPGVYGGTGKTGDWQAIALWNGNRAIEVPFVLAGGLKPENVADAIRAVRPDGVDTASGVESSPGRKDPALVSRFVENARQGFASIR